MKAAKICNKKLLIITTLGFFTLALLIIFIIKCKDTILEEYYIMKLNSGDNSVITDSIQKLRDMKSIRAVPSLIKSLKRKNLKRDPWDGGVKANDDSGLYTMTFIEIGENALPYLIYEYSIANENSLYFQIYWTSIINIINDKITKNHPEYIFKGKPSDKINFLNRISDEIRLSESARNAAKKSLKLLKNKKSY